MRKLTNNDKRVLVVLVAVAITGVVIIFALPKPTSTVAPTTTTAPAHHQVTATTTDPLVTQFHTFCTTVGRVNKDMVTLEYGVVPDSAATVSRELAVLKTDSASLGTEALGLGGTKATWTDALGQALTTDGDVVAAHPPSTTAGVVADFSTSNNDIQDLYGLCVNSSGGLPPLGQLPF